LNLRNFFCSTINDISFLFNNHYNKIYGLKVLSYYSINEKPNGVRNQRAFWKIA